MTKTKKKDIFVSVIMNCFNGQAYLKESLDNFHLPIHQKLDSILNSLLINNNLFILKLIIKNNL